MRPAGLALLIWLALAFWGAWATLEVGQAVHEDGKHDGLSECSRTRADLVYYEALADSLCTWYFVEGEKRCSPKYSIVRTVPVPEGQLP